MPRDPDTHSDAAAASVSLATEAALLEARLRALHEALDTVDARIKAVSDALRRLRRSASVSNVADREVHGGSPSQDEPPSPTPSTHAQSG
ncbi:hypothetical protein [Streptomyces sp. NBC_00316]|uniref:hypothetical protein n=1 Tax=Streptomyces sp. NBC_00316 TaxID=2975710 RepID=UPI002E2A568D|nr:hypothetical protein [Streptomyces sp. NBC_00316]